MQNKVKNILQVSAVDFEGRGVGWDLFRAYAKLGYNSWLAVGKKRSPLQEVLQIPNDKPRSWWETTTFTAAQWCNNKIGKFKGAGRARNFFNNIGRYRNYGAWLAGREPFDYPGTKKLLELPPAKPDIVHCHNLHGKYFDLNELPFISSQVPLIMTLHDSWLLTGHCACSITCQRWKIGCGNCPELQLYPAVRRDATDANWLHKKNIYTRSRLYLITPSQWLMNRVQQSMLTAAQLKTKVIHHGVNLDIFKPGNKRVAREKLILSPNAKIVLFVANSVRTNIWKDYATVRKAASLLARKMPNEQIILLCVGSSYPPEFEENLEVRFIPHNVDPSFMAICYQSADIYLHASRTEVAGLVILEALACGIPVVATAVDGIGEHIKSLIKPTKLDQDSVIPSLYGPSDATGCLVNRGDSQNMAQQAEFLLTNPDLYNNLSKNAVRDSAERFDFRREVQEYLDWYDYALDDFLAAHKPKNQSMIQAVTQL